MKIVKYIIPSLVVGLFLVFGTAYANPAFFNPPITTSTASSTPAYLTVATATTTLTYDTFVNGSTYKADSAVLLTQFTASSTASLLTITPEYSQDGIDWYQDNLNTQGTTSPSTSLQVPHTYSWLFASSTIGGQPATPRVSKAILLTTPTRFIRIIYTITGNSGAVWGEIVPNKQQAQ